MKLRLLFILLLSGCASTHVVPQDSHSQNAFEYCGGELWGYVLPLGPREQKSFWRKNLQDPKPLLAAFLHLHSDLEKNPAQALTFYFAIRTRESLGIKIPSHDWKVKINGADERSLNVEYFLKEEAKNAGEIYRYPKYQVKLLDAATNRWQVTQVSQFAYFIRGTPQEVTLPTSKVQKLETSLVQASLDLQNYKEIFVMASKNIWPENTDLKNAKIQITIPTMTVNDLVLDPQTFAFDMNYEKVRAIRSKSSRTLCPSTEKIFQMNDGIL